MTIYHDRVDCLFKATYWPAAETVIRKKYDNDEKPSSAATNAATTTTTTMTTSTSSASSEVLNALEQSIYFMAICTMTESECEQMMYESKKNLLHRHRHAVEAALTRSEFLVNPDKLTLQSFVLYLVCFFFSVEEWREKKTDQETIDGIENMLRIRPILVVTSISNPNGKCFGAATTTTTRIKQSTFHRRRFEITSMVLYRHARFSNLN